jgi:SAM-dependent methyltransferase
MEQVQCNLCGSEDYVVVFEATVPHVKHSAHYSCTNCGHGEHGRVVRCRGCGLHYVSPRPAGEELADLYASVEDPVYQDEMDGRMRMFRRNVRNLNRHAQKGRVLDVGCSIGIFLNLAKQDGWSIAGLEPSQWCVERGRKLFGYGEEVQVGGYHHLADRGESYEAVTLWDVLEHVDDPLDALKACGAVLKPGGVLGLSTVDIGSLYAQLMGRRWPWLMKMHLYYFDRRTIRRYLDMAGFDVLEIRIYRHVVSLNYLRYKLRRIHSLAYQLLTLIQKILLFGRTIYVPVALGDFMEVYARKRNQGEG